MSDFSILNNRKIVDILIGDEYLIEVGALKLAMPYMSGPDLCELCTQFGYPQMYKWGGGTKSRWMYMGDLIKYLDKTNRIPLLLSYLFELSRFETVLEPFKDADQKKEYHKKIVDEAISKINSSLMFSQKELRVQNKQFVLATIGDNAFIETPVIDKVSLDYVRNLPERIKTDFDTQNYDSVVTKSRTLIEEVLIHIIESSSSSSNNSYNYNGDFKKLLKEVKELLGIRQKSEWDKRVNEMLSGLEKIMDAIIGMRNSNSDAHGTGQSRIKIKGREARLIANAAMMYSEYVLSVYESQQK